MDTIETDFNTLVDKFARYIELYGEGVASELVATAMAEAIDRQPPKVIMRDLINRSKLIGNSYE